MSSSDSLVSYESFQEEAQRTIRRHKSSACIGSRRQSIPSATTHVHPYAQHRTPRRPLHPAISSSNSSNRDDRVSVHLSRGQPDTDFKYAGSIEECGWKAGQVPLFLEWYPEKLDRRSTLKFFESGREYTIGRSPSCDIFFQNSEPDSGISAQHLKIKVSHIVSEVLIEDYLSPWPHEPNLCMGH
jgi:hypothetical protein